MTKGDDFEKEIGSLFWGSYSHIVVMCFSKFRDCRAASQQKKKKALSRALIKKYQKRTNLTADKQEAKMTSEIYFHSSFFILHESQHCRQQNGFFQGFDQ